MLEMKLVAELRKNNGQFKLDHFIDNTHAYEHTFKSLLKRRDYALLYNTLKCYCDLYRDMTKYPLISYRPGYDYITSYYSLYIYAQMMEKGIKGVVEPNKEESDYAYLQLLQRIEQVPNYMKKVLYSKSHLLLKHAYPDLMDRYSLSLYNVGKHYLKLKDYKKAFKFFKKGADFGDMGRQIVYPYYLIGRNQSFVADMYYKGQGTKKNIEQAIRYYRKSAENCGRKEHPRMGDIYLERGEYSKAFLAYTEITYNWPWRYSRYFMHPLRLKSKFKKILNGLNKINNRSEIDTICLAMMYEIGLGCDQDIEKSKELLPNKPEWVDRWANNYYPMY